MKNWFQFQAIRLASGLAELGSIEYQRTYWNKPGYAIHLPEETFAYVLDDFNLSTFIEEWEKRRALLGDANCLRTVLEELLKYVPSSIALLENPDWIRSTAMFAEASIWLSDQIATWLGDEISPE